MWQERTSQQTEITRFYKTQTSGLAVINTIKYQEDD